MGRGWLLVLLALASCINRDKYTYATEVQLHLRELRANGQAQVSTYKRVEDKVFGPDPGIIRIDQVIDFRGAKMSIAKLAESCPDDAPPEDNPGGCELSVAGDTPIVLASEHHHAIDKIGHVLWIATLVTGVVGGVTCAIACDSDVLQVTSGVTAAVIVLYELISNCHPSQGCHD